ncbi:PD-(D/E)XK nuclease-like domain-containing protein [Nocardia transvalensis]|uniref:PD-(D/E)XK nuclease-like domain-containing protein n=1 Tax=Nocardia transvalensis TaxID=37333 RepID=UPI0018942891|nr:PD-(D/E)XK nuclease-like domain-containing protein [Nocardia transvalensis]MBF6328756.1 PD-(D/E)XK nuclease-like domain-containing protein [Nocardia transvalensis]
MYAGIPNTVYHADTASLSSSGVRRLLETCPAQFRYERDNPRTDSADHFDIGTAFHTLTLGDGPEIMVVDADSWRSKDAQRQQIQAWQTGRTPLLTKQYATVTAMADAVRGNELAAVLLEGGTAELSLYCRDHATGVMLRARPDWLPENTATRLIMVDLKSADTACPATFSASAARYGYAEQADWYRQVAITLGLDPDPAFVFIVVSKRPPHLVSVVELDTDALAYGHSRNRRAIDTYARCVETDTWPGWGTDVHLVGLPNWAYYQEENRP